MLALYHVVQQADSQLSFDKEDEGPAACEGQNKEPSEKTSPLSGYHK